MKTGIKVSDAMTKSPVYAKPEDTILACAEKMKEHDIGSLIIKKEGKLLGIVTETDFLAKVIANREDTSIPVKKIMTKKEDIISIAGNEDLYDAILTMSREDVRRLPVISEEFVLGLLTHKDILKIHPDLYDIFVQKYKIREPEEKPSKQHYVEGVCPSCRSYNKLTRLNGRWRCEPCRIK
ncbi:CBS domain-containing protein [archaeon]|jgi:signal-transduction protein with cAMP-binding, CBS, and nucleotidyltransferase domain|nr:CBS domain-containing protein [archaeon]MBT6824466.1 CBS domain-containing protein [archaeon]MBT7106851.1 CBS domain-containing protein [archaeon]MBT7297799.1 CBS domain-containing protein [archaeon]